MAHHIDWDNIHLHMHDTDVRYKRRLLRKKLYIECSPSINDVSPANGSLKKLKTVKDQIFMGDDELVVACPNVVSNIKPIGVEFGGKRNHEHPELEMVKEGLREGGKSLVCIVDDNASDDVSLKKLENVQDRKFLCNDEFWVECSNVVSNPKPIRAVFGGKRNDAHPDSEMVKEGLTEGGVCKVEDDASDDVSLKKLENVQDRKFLCDDEFWVECSNVVSNAEPIGVICGTMGDAVDPDFKILKEDLKEERHSLASSVVGVKKLKNVQDQDLRDDEVKVSCRYSDVKFGAKKMIVDPDHKNFMENLKVTGHSYALKVKKKDRSLVYLKYEKDVLSKEYQRKSKGDNVKSVLGKQKGDTAKNLRNNIRKEKRDKVVPRGDVIFVSSKEKRNVMLRREGFSGNSNRSPVAKRSSVVKRRDNMEIINIGKPNVIEEVTTSKNNRPSKIIRNKRQRPLNLADGHNIEHLRKSKKKHEKIERRPCLTSIDRVSNLMDIAGKSKRQYRRTIPKNKRRDLVVQQGEDIQNSRFSSGIGNMDVLVKVEKFGDSTDAVVKKRRQMIPGRDSVYDSNLRPRYKCYKRFGKYAEVKEENANILNYDEEDNEHSSDLEILEPDNKQNLSKFEVMKVFNASVIEDYPRSMASPSDYENPKFREELMDILRRPFNLEEYRSLMQKAKYRHLMGGPEYSDGLKGKKVSNTYGKSPLDYHPDVQKRLSQCRKISRRLNILRGFMYWYGRACQDGAFKPWLDKSCSAVTPSPR